MVRKKIKEKNLTQKLKSHGLYFLLTPILGWFMGDLLNTPTIKAFSVVLLAFIISAISLDTWIKPKICCRVRSEIYYCITYSGLLIVYVLIAIPFWNKLVFMCDRNNPYKQPLTTAVADIQVIVDSNNTFKEYGEMGYLVFANGRMDVVEDHGRLITISVKRMEGYIFKMMAMSPTYGERINNNQIRYGAKLQHLLLSPAIGKPIYELSQAKYALLHFDNIPDNSKIASGLIICVFNGSLRIEIPVPSQVMGRDAMVIPIKQKYFLAPVKKEINYEIFTVKTQ